MASDLNGAAQSIEQYVEDNWAATPIAWEGVDFDPPDGPWIQVTIRWGDGFIETMGGTGSGTNTVPGVLFINLFDQPGGGAGTIEGHADDIRDLFNRAEIGGVRFDAPSGPKPATDQRDEGEWLQRTVTVPFELIETI